MATQKGKKWSAKQERLARVDPYGLEEAALEELEGWNPTMADRRVRDAGYTGADDWREAKPAQGAAHKH
jgi:hypothetical protein